jgi:hypothetical protein
MKTYHKRTQKIPSERFKLDLVQLSEGIWISQSPVTCKQYQTVTGLPEVYTDLEPYGVSQDLYNQPVTHRTYREALEFCLRLSVATNRTYRLPLLEEYELLNLIPTTYNWHESKLWEYLYNPRLNFKETEDWDVDTEAVKGRELDTISCLAAYDPDRTFRVCLDQISSYKKPPVLREFWSESAYIKRNSLSESDWESLSTMTYEEISHALTELQSTYRKGDTLVRLWQNISTLLGGNKQ